jgi:hypothetical protein
MEVELVSSAKSFQASFPFLYAVRYRGFGIGELATVDVAGAD